MFLLFSITWIREVLNGTNYNVKVVNVGWSKEGKVKLLIKAYLTLNRNRKCTSKEISNWITVNNFGMSNTNVHPNMVTKLVKTGIGQGDRIFRDVCISKGKRVNEIWMEG